MTNIELNTKGQTDKEGIRSFWGHLEFKGWNCQLEHKVKCPSCYHEFKSDALELFIRQAMLTKMKDKNIQKEVFRTQGFADMSYTEILPLIERLEKLNTGLDKVDARDSKPDMRPN